MIDIREDTTTYQDTRIVRMSTEDIPGFEVVVTKSKDAETGNVLVLAHGTLRVLSFDHRNPFAAGHEIAALVHNAYYQGLNSTKEN